MKRRFYPRLFPGNGGNSKLQKKKNPDWWRLSDRNYSKTEQMDIPSMENTDIKICFPANMSFLVPLRLESQKQTAFLSSPSPKVE